MKVKFKCPFCKQDYELEGAEILELRHQRVKCAACDKRFYLAETIPCLGHSSGRGFDASGLVSIIEIEASINENQKNLEELQERLKAKRPTQAEIADGRYGDMDKESYKDFKEDMTDLINDAKETLTDLKEELKDAKEEYSAEKKDLPSKTETEKEVYRCIGVSFCKGELAIPPNDDDLQKLMRIFKNGNEYSDGLALTFQRYGMEYCLKNQNP